MTAFFHQIFRLKYWLACAVFIITLSIYGRKLQRLIAERVDGIWIAVIVFCLLFFLLGFLYYKRKIYSISKPVLLFSFCLLTAGGAVVYYKYLLPVETLHFLVFSCYGWIAAAVFGPLYGAIAVLAMAVGDEVLQYYLPSRVGDLHDVLINSLSGFSGLLLRIRW